MSNRFFLQITFLMGALVVAALVLSGCGSGPSAAPVATPDASDCKRSFIAALTGAIAEAESRAKFESSMKALRPEGFPTCTGLPDAQKVAIREQAVAAVTPLMVAKVAEWE
jgi:hypothetical protein